MALFTPWHRSAQEARNEHRFPVIRKRRDNIDRIMREKPEKPQTVRPIRSVDQVCNILPEWDI